MKAKLLILFSAISIVMYAQQTPLFSWNIGVGSTGYDKVFDMTVDNSNNIITVGQFGATVNFDPKPSAAPPAGVFTSNGIYDMFIAKYNPNGNLMWAKAMGGSGQDYANSVVVDASNNVYVFGDFYNSIDYNPGAPGQHTFTGQSGLSDMILLKYDSVGTLVWAKQIGGNSIDHSSALTIDSHGDLYLTGSFYATADFNPDTAVANTLTSLGQGDVFISKYDKDGNFIWVKHIGAAGFQSVNNITADSQDNVIISGTFNDSPDFNPGAGVDSIPVATQYGNVVYFAKYDLNGNYIWAKGIQSNGFKSIGDLQTDNTGSFYVTGAFEDTTDFDPTNGVTELIAPQGNSFIYFGKYDASGNLMWVKYFDHPGLGGQDGGTSIALDGQNNLFLTGQFWGQGCDFDPSATGTAILGSNASNNYDIYIAKYTNTGNYLWAHNIGDSGSDTGVKIEFDNDNSLIFSTICGASTFGGAALPSDYDFTAGVSEYASAGSEDFTITKYTQCYINPATGLVGNTITAFANNVSYQWLNCEVGFAPIANATLQSYTPTNTGSYACTMSYGGCVDTTICIAVDLCVGITNSITINAQTLTLTCSVSGATYQWIRTDVGNLAIAGATSQTYTPTVNGSYACKITKNGCVNTSAPISVDKVGLEEFNNDLNVTLFPNPANDFVVASFITGATNIQVQLFDVVGKLIDAKILQSKNNITINTENLSKGVYTLKFFETSTNKVVVRRFIKE